MKRYWLEWILLTIFKAAMLGCSVLGAIGGILYPQSYLLLAIIFIPLSIWFLYDFVYQVLIPGRGGRGYQLHKPSDTPMYMGLGPPWKTAKEELNKGRCIIWS